MERECKHDLVGEILTANELYELGWERLADSAFGETWYSKKEGLWLTRNYRGRITEVYNGGY